MDRLYARHIATCAQHRDQKERKNFDLVSYVRLTETKTMCKNVLNTKTAKNTQVNGTKIPYAVTLHEFVHGAPI